MKAKKGFTLVEILIVVVVLGILAAVVIPQFTDASTQAKESSLLSNLQAIRSQIELYKIQHSDALPGAGTATFVQAMTGKTDVAGAVDASGAYGPYVKSIPDNPFNDCNTVTTGTGTPGSGGTTSGWYFNTSSGNFNADDSNDHAGW